MIFFRNEPRALSRKEIIESVRQSLANLQMDYVDIVVISKYDPNCTMEGELRRFPSTPVATVCITSLCQRSFAP